MQAALDSNQALDVDAAMSYVEDSGLNVRDLSKKEKKRLSKLKQRAEEPIQVSGVKLSRAQDEIGGIEDTLQNMENEQVFEGKATMQE